MKIRTTMLAALVLLIGTGSLPAGEKAPPAQKESKQPPDNPVEPAKPIEPAKPATAADPIEPDTPATAPALLPVEKLTQQAADSIAVISFVGRSGKTEGMGTGFVISADGLVATNLHVIGQARPINVRLANGKQYDVKSVHASDRVLDLAVLKIEAKDLKPLPLGDSSAAANGQPVVAIGNPRGLEHSVVAGVVSARREVDGRPMLQLAIPIEPGNSGGPVLDAQGRVLGVMNMKSLVTPNLGFAVEIDSLKPLLEKPNPIAMERWLTIGALDPKEWTSVFGARWSQRAGRLYVDGWGGGFGGRALCLQSEDPPQPPYEFQVAVKMEDDGGAAGLVFCADGRDLHYGFYPSAGKLRLSRFEGSDVFTWQVLRELRSEHYRPGDWNYLKVRVEKDRFRCYVNDQLVVESNDSVLAPGKIGLAKFRNTQAEFKQFRVAEKLAPVLVPEALANQVTALTQKLSLQDDAGEILAALAPAGRPAIQALREEAKELEQRAGRLRTLALQVHRQRVLDELAKLVEGKDEDIDLVHAALLLAWHDNEEVEVSAYLREFERLISDLRSSLPPEGDAQVKLARLNKYLFEELGFHGSRGDYYNRSNSYFNEVLDDREAIPITLSVLYIECARRIGIPAEGVGFPGHFMVRLRPAKSDPHLVDAYDGGKLLSAKEVRTLIEGITGKPLADVDLPASSNRAILVRMLHNLMATRRQAQDPAKMLPYLDAILTLSPEAAWEHWMRAVFRFQTGQHTQAGTDVAWLLKHQPPEVPLEQVRQLERLIEEQTRDP